MIRAVYYQFERAPVVVEIEDGLKDLQTLVGGYIEFAETHIPNLSIICNEEGRLLGLPENRGFAGNFLVVRTLGSEIVSLRDSDVIALMSSHQPISNV